MTDAPPQSFRDSMTRLGGCVDPVMAVRLRRDDSHPDLPGIGIDFDIEFVQAHPMS